MKINVKIFEIKFSRFSSILAIICFAFSIGISQTAKNKLSFNIGQSTFKADNRKDFLYGKVGQSIIDYVKYHKPSNDKEYFVNAMYSYKLKKNALVEFGLGYSKVITDIKLPVNIFHFNFNYTAIFYSKKYSKHQLQIPLNIHFLLYNKKSSSVSLGFNNYTNLSFRKEVTIYNKWSVNRINFSSFEIYPSLNITMGPIIIKCEYRLWNFKYKDDALDNNGLTWDRYNPSKIRVGLGFNFFSYTKLEK